MKAQWNASTLTWEFGNYYSRCIQNRRCASVAILRGQLYVCGGYHLHQNTSSVERFDPTRNTCERLAPMRYARGDASAVVIDGRLLIVGRRNYDDDDGTDEGDEEFDEGALGGEGEGDESDEGVRGDEGHEE